MLSRMHRPVRPKSAKGKSRTTHPSIPQHESRRKASITTTSIFAQASTSQLVGPGPSNASNRKTSAQNPPNASRNFDRSSRNAVQKSTTITSRLAQASRDEKEPQMTAELSFPEITRPTSSLSKYHILPSISPAPHPPGHSFAAVSEPSDGVQLDNDVDLLTDRAQQMILDSARQRSNAMAGISSPSSASKRKFAKVTVDQQEKRPRVSATLSAHSHANRHHPARGLKYKTTSRSQEVTKVPREPGPTENSLLIALKLPDGTRVERRFLPTTTLHGILTYAHSQYPIVPIAQCNVFRMDVMPKKKLPERGKTLEQLQIKNRTVLYIEEDEDF